MIKSVEAVIAITVLFMFVMVLFNSYTYNDYKENLLTENVYQVINLKAQEKEFRDIINDNNVSVIYNFLYNHIDTSYAVKICEYLSTDDECIFYGDLIPLESAIYSVNYYFYDSNKTLNVMIWT